MLTNNKKRSFVKLIALTLAALMVFSVCLTGCTDEDARLAAEAAKDAADKAQSSADAAQTAADSKTTTEAVAAQIAEALKPYLKADAALTEADVDKKVADLKAAIEASLKNYQAKGDYATKADVDKKQDKGNYATKDDLKNYQGKGDYATKGDLAGYQTKGDYATKEDLKALSGFASSEELAELTAALNEFTEAALTEDAIAEIVTEALIGFATEAYVDDAIAAAKAEEREITTKEIADAIAAALADYDLTVQDRIDALEKKLTEKIESYFGAFEPDQVVELLKDVDKAMDAEEWGAATVLVIRVLEKASKLFDHVLTRNYTQARKTEINTIMGKINGLDTDIVIFETHTSTYEESGTKTIGTYLKDAHTNNLLDVDATTGELKNIDTRVATARILTKLTVFILRAATVEEIVGIETAIDNAMNVPDFVADITAWRNELYNIGDEYAVQKLDANGKYVNDEWNFGDATKNYHNASFKKTTKLAQVATYADEAAYKSSVAKLEEMVITYLFEAMAFGTSDASDTFGAWNTNVAALWKNVNGNTTTYKWFTPGQYVDEYVQHADGSKFYTTALTINGTKPGKPTGDGTWTFVGYFAGIDESAIPAAAKSVATYTSVYTPVKELNWVATPVPATVEFGSVMAGFFDGEFLDPKIKIDLSSEYSSYITPDTAVEHLLDKYTPGEANGQAQLSVTYQALAQMINDAKYANKIANDRFTGRPAGPVDPTPNTPGMTAAEYGVGDNNYYVDHHTDNGSNWNDFFLWHIGHNESKIHNTKADGTGDYTCNCSLWGDDDQYVKALKAYMVEQTESEPFEPVPTSWQAPVWLTPVTDLTGTKTVAPWNYRNADANVQLQAHTIDVYFDYALNINGITNNPDTYAPIARYALWEKLHRAAWEVLYAKYAAYANQVLNTMVNDFRVVAKAAATNAYGTDGSAFITGNDTAAAALNLHNVPGDITSQWTDGFITAYTNGAASNNQWYWTVGTANGVKKQIGPSYTIEGLAQYYANNGLAKYPIGVNPSNGVVAFDTVTSDVVAAIGAAQATLDTMLVASSVGPRKQIIADSAKYANGISDEDWAVLKGKRVQDAFDEVLGAAMDNLEEIMYRFMYTEINEAFINKAYAAVTQTVNNTVTGNHTYANGVADFFAQNDNKTLGAQNVDASLDALRQMMQLYVSGYTVAGNAATDYADLANNKVYTNQGFKVEAKTVDSGTVYVYSPKANVVFANAYMSVDAKTAEIYSQLKANTITNAQQAQLGDVIDKSATNALAQAKTIYANSVNTMANMAVKYRFHDYIQQAKDSAYFSYLAYVAVAGNYNQRLALDTAYNTAANSLTITEYYAQRGAYEEAGVMKYLSYFVENVLAVSTAATSPYYELMGSEGSSYAAQLQNVSMVKAAFKAPSGVTKAAELAQVIDPATFWTLAKKKEFLNEAYVGDVDGADADTNPRTDENEQYSGNVLFVIPQSPLNGLLNANNYYSTGSATISYDAVVNP